MSVLLHILDPQNLCRICCQFFRKCSYCIEKQESTGHIFLINVKNDNGSLHPDKICQKCYCVISTTIKSKSTITAAFENWTELSFQQCYTSTFITKSSTWNTKIWLQEKKAKVETKNWSQSFFDSCSANKINNSSCSKITRSQQ